MENLQSEECVYIGGGDSLVICTSSPRRICHYLMVLSISGQTLPTCNWLRTGCILFYYLVQCVLLDISRACR